MADSFAKYLHQVTRVERAKEPNLKNVFFFSPAVFLKPAKQECDDRHYNEDYHKNFCNFHRETGDPPCTQYIEYQCQYKENNSKPNQIHKTLTS